MRISTPKSRQDLHIKKRYRVLEIGPGNNPSFRADVLADKFLGDDSHRSGGLRIYPHQKLVNAAAEALPFADKEFDYVICNQVLEHSDDPAQFLREVMRVGKAGYIETPSLLGEWLFPKQSHRYVVLCIGDKLVLYDKQRVPGNYANDYGELFLNYLPYQSLPYKLLPFSEGELMHVRYEWKDDIDFLVNPTDEYYSKFFLKKWDRQMSARSFRRADSSPNWDVRCGPQHTSSATNCAGRRDAVPSRSKSTESSIRENSGSVIGARVTIYNSIPCKNIRKFRMFFLYLCVQS